MARAVMILSAHHAAFVADVREYDRFAADTVSPRLRANPSFLSVISAPLRANQNNRRQKSGISWRFRHPRQRDIFLAIAGHQREFAGLPVVLRFVDPVARRADEIPPQMPRRDRKSTRLNSSH